MKTRHSAEGVVTSVEAKPYENGRTHRTGFVTKVTVDTIGKLTYGFDKKFPLAIGSRVAFDYTVDDERGFKDFVPETVREIPNQREAKSMGPAGGLPHSIERAPGVVEVAYASPPQSQQSEELRQQRIVMQHSQDMALAKIKLLLEQNALPITGAATKAAVSKRYEEITAMIDKETQRAYNDAMTLRLAFGNVLTDAPSSLQADADERDGVTSPEPAPAKEPF